MHGGLSLPYSEEFVCARGIGLMHWSKTLVLVCKLLLINGDGYIDACCKCVLFKIQVNSSIIREFLFLSVIFFWWRALFCSRHRSCFISQDKSLSSS